MSSSAPSPADRGATALTVRDCVVVRGGRTVLRIAALDVPAGQVTVVIGPNGSGKSTLLAVLQLLLKPERADLRLGGTPMWDDPLATRRRMASAFQEPLLLNTSVLKNLETALGLRKVPRRARRARAERWLDRFGVVHVAQRHARALSGGEAQRVSLARAFALEPELLLLDEPFSALDAPTRASLIDDFAGVLRESAVTTVLVTHDRDEALRLADRLVVLIDGSVRQVGAPAAVFGAPADEEVAAFVGVENVWPATLVASADGVATYLVAGHRLDVATADPAAAALFCIRPEEITLYAGTATTVAGSGSARNRLPATVQAIEPAGPVVRLRLRLDQERLPGDKPVPGDTPVPGDKPVRGELVEPRPDAPTLVATLTRPSLETLNLALGSRVTASFKATAAHVIPQR